MDEYNDSRHEQENTAPPLTPGEEKKTHGGPGAPDAGERTAERGESGPAIQPEVAPLSGAAETRAAFGGLADVLPATGSNSAESQLAEASTEAQKEDISDGSQPEEHPAEPQPIAPNTEPWTAPAQQPSADGPGTAYAEASAPVAVSAPAPASAYNSASPPAVAPTPSPAYANAPTSPPAYAPTPASAYANPPAYSATYSSTNPHNGATASCPPPAYPTPGAYPTPAAFPVPGTYPPPLSRREPLHATPADGRFALGTLLLGFLFLRWFFPLSGWGVPVFTGLFCGAVLLLAKARRVAPAKESWFWLGSLAAGALSAWLWPFSGPLSNWLGLFLFAAALYWCGSLFGILCRKKTGNYLPLDALNLAIMVPFRNFAAWFQCIPRMGGKKTAASPAQTDGKPADAPRAKHPVLAVLLALALFLPVLAMVMPLLMEADSGPFGQLLQGLGQWLRGWFNFDLPEVAWQLVLGFPVALYICGLAVGAAHKRCTGGPDLRKTEKGLAALRIIPTLTSGTLLLLVSAVYVVFILCQIPYFFSAFQGLRPAGFEVYSEYARAGFFELCRIAAINLGLMALFGAFAKTKLRESGLMRAANLVLSVLTILLVATAFSKMALYIGAYGLSARRLQTCVFMVFLVALYGAVIALQCKGFSIVRFGAVLGTAMFCLLCLSNPAGLVARYNAERYLDGTLQDFDTSVLWPAGYDGWVAGQQVAAQTQDKTLRSNIQSVLTLMEQDARYQQGRSTDTLSARRIRAA